MRNPREERRRSASAADSHSTRLSDDESTYQLRAQGLDQADRRTSNFSPRSARKAEENDSLRLGVRNEHQLTKVFVFCQEDSIL